MRMLSLALARGAMTLVTGCEDTGARRPDDVTQSNLNAARRIVANDPARRQDLMNSCRADIRMNSKNTNNNVAVVMGVSPAQVPTVFCDRMIEGVQSGRLDATDINESKRGNITPKMLAVLQAR